MDFGKPDGRKVEEQAAQVPVVPTIATTPFMPAIPTPVPIWTPEMANQFHSHSNGIPAGFDLSAYPEISNWPNHRSEPSPFAHHNAANRVQISFDSIPSSSNGIPQLLTQPDLPLPYSAVTNEGQFIPPYNSQFIPTYTSFNQHQLLGVEQPFLNTMHNQYAELPGSSYFDYCSKTFAQIAPHQDDVIAAETRKDAATPTTMEERNREGEDKNNASTMCYNPRGKINGPTTEVAAVPAAQEDKRRDFDLNKTPQPKQPKRRKHRPKVIKEGQPKRTIKKAAAKTVQSKGNQAEKKKARKGLNTTPPQTGVTGEWTSGPKSTVKTCQRSLSFGSKEQAIDDPGRRENMLFANASSSRNRAADHNGLQECPNNSIGRDGWSTGCGLQATGSKRKQPGIEQADNTRINLLGAQYNDMKAYCLNYGVQFPNVHKKRRSVKGRISEAPRKSSVTATKDVQLATFLQDARSHSYMSSPKCWASGSDYTAAGVPHLITATERATQDKHQPLEYTLSLGQKRPTKRRSRASTRTDVGLAHTAKQTCSSDRRTFGDAEGPQTCIDALVADLGASITKKKRTGKRGPVSYASSCKNERQENTLACVEEREEIEIADKNVDALADHFIFLNINREAPERESHGQQNGTIVPYKPKKRSIRPKVDIDEETNKVWALLLKDINNSGVDGSDAEKAIKWEQEREVYRGRAENFIAKMHQIQGDRGFSMWKGSVVDSVVGVFLTQNVSDHLSSSAFMALAARFPLKSTSTSHNESTSSHKNSTDESDSKKFESVQRNNNEHSPVDSAMTEEGQESLCQGSVRKELHNIISSQLAGVTSQTSGDFPTDQNPEKIGSFSDSNSEIEDLPSTAQFNICYNRTPFRELLDMASSTMLHDVNGQRCKATECFTGRSDQSIDLNHDNQIGNLEKSDVIPYTLETLATKEVTPNSGALQVNGYDRLTTEVPSSDSLKDKDENDKKYNFPESDSQEQTQEPKQKEREKDVGNPNNEKRKGEGKKKSASVKPKGKKENNFDWDSLRVQAQAQAGKREKTEKTMDSVDWDAVRRADVNEISKTIKERGMNNMLAERIQSFLNLLVDKHKGIDLEWLRDVPPDQAKEFLLSIKGLGLKSVECIRLLTLHHLAFPVDTNVGRIAVRLGWVPIQPLPESLQLHLLELYPVLDAVQKYLWPRLCKLDQRTLYELHYQLITFGKVFCTKSKPNCNACPMRGECRHFASAFASARLALPGPEERMANTSGDNATEQKPSQVINQTTLLLHENPIEGALQQIKTNHPIVEMPPSPDPERSQFSQGDIEDAFKKDSSEIPDIQVDMAKFALSIQKYVQQNMELQEGEMSKALVALNPDVALIPTPKLKNVSKLRTEHYVYELPDSHPLLKGWQAREPDDPGRYLLAIWTPGETADSIQPPERKCSSQDSDQLCEENECCACNSFREANSEIVRGTILIPCRTAMKGSFPLNGTYFQVNEVFADNDSSINPISVPRSWIWNLERRTVYFGTSVSSIFKGLSTQIIQQCFWKGYVCVRGFDRETRAPRPLLARLHFTASRTPKTPKAPKTPKTPKTPKKKGNTEKMSHPANGLNKTKSQPELFSSIQETTEPSRQ